MTTALLLKTFDGQELNVASALAEQPAFVIGSDYRAGLRLTAPGIQPAHAVISLRNGEYVISPRFATAPVSVNGKPLRFPTPLKAGDNLRLADVSLTVTHSDVQVPVASPVVKTAIMPQSHPAVPARPAASIAAIPMPAQTREVYFPKMAESGGRKVSALLSGVFTLIVVACVVGYGLLKGTPTTAADLNQRFAFNDDHVTVVMFETSWCQFCKAQKPILTSLAGEYRGKVYNQFLDAEAAVNSDLVSAFNVNSYPVTVIFNDQGQVTAKFLGLTDERIIRLAIEQALTESVG